MVEKQWNGILVARFRVDEVDCEALNRGCELL